MVLFFLGHVEYLLQRYVYKRDILLKYEESDPHTRTDSDTPETQRGTSKAGYSEQVRVPRSSDMGKRGDGRL